MKGENSCKKRRKTRWSTVQRVGGGNGNTVVGHIDRREKFAWYSPPRSTLLAFCLNFIYKENFSGVVSLILDFVLLSHCYDEIRSLLTII